ncbi:MAG: isoleucine--tRNA ligase [Sedimentisphaerales bacterium]|nr:isoleucine--tRNA ligase [Sedimentisphaerales bacterium]
MSNDQKHNYRDTLNLPETSFSMKANLVQREPQMRKRWAEQKLYTRIREARRGARPYTLHDGPPYANGDIHMGHVINKVLKDFVVKYRTMIGFNAPYIPGWDCHGLPIESKVMTDLGEKAKSMPKQEIRRECMKYAGKYVKIQSRQFQDLGVLGDFDDPYLTFKPSYEAGILEVFAELVGKGLVYKQLKPIHWCIGCETALAEAELEYKDVASPSIFVNFQATEETVKRLIEMGLVTSEQAQGARVCLMIWTTTPWTLAANLAVAVHPFLDYTAVSYQKDGHKFVSVVATDRLNAVVQAGGLKEGEYRVAQTKVRGSDLEGLRYRHPFMEHNPTDKDAYMVILADYVTTEDGTGLVHTAPGHGLEDYMSGQKYGLAVYSPVMNDGRYDDTVPQWLRGRSVLDVEKDVNNHLHEHGWLFAQSQIQHSYPHCWRSRDPVIFRATEQWFVAVDKPLPGAGKTLRQMAMESVEHVQWIPAWGRKRIAGMLESRPDWCISRQRSWGLPIPVFILPDGRPLLTKESVQAVAKHTEKHGSDSWFTHTPRQILGDDFPLPPGVSLDELQKEENIFDVWFESGCSWYSVCSRREHWPIPVDMYLEGSDQHRGWFQLSLLPALGTIERAPFKSVLTHGFTVDEKGMKQSKSLGNYVNAQDEVTKYGADILRLWVSSVNYQEDVRCTDELIGRTQDAYRKIRNTLRYLFGNSNDFDPAKDAVPYERMVEIDQWAMQQLQRLIAETTEAYESSTFHRVFSLVYNFCSVEMSSIYMDVLKDRMYCDAADSPSRRSGQTAMYHVLGALVRLFAPVLVHTAEEAWDAMKVKPETCDSIHLAHMPKVDPSIDYAGQEAKWQKLMSLRDEVLKVLEGLRRDTIIGSNQEASVTVRATSDDAAAIKAFGVPQFATLCIVSELKLEEGAAQTTVTANKSPHPKCQRCWNYWPSVGTNAGHPDICARCASVVCV